VVAQQKTVAQQEKRIGELVSLFNKQDSANDVLLGGKSYVASTNPAGTTKTFDTSGLSSAELDKQVFEYAGELAGGMPIKPVLRNGVPLESRWSITLIDGTTINVRSVSSSGVGRWTIDVQNKDVWSPLVGRDKVELKFK
jgi:hypothetical protein